MQIANIRFIYKIGCRIAGYRNRERRLHVIDMTTCGYRNDSCRNWFCQLQQPIDVYMSFRQVPLHGRRTLQSRNLHRETTLNDGWGSPHPHTWERISQMPRLQAYFTSLIFKKRIMVFGSNKIKDSPNYLHLLVELFKSVQ